ncbi:MAG TPA: Rap1a/Tai family immunity protein [Novosphingobium sp.]|nr:Rap1a/Tai family immunity protein [Novosphingobium sp.]
MTGLLAIFLPLAAATATAAAPPAQQQQESATAGTSGFQSAGQVLRKCRDESSFSKSYCFAYIAAVADSARAYQAWLGTNGMCLPNRTSQGTLVDVFDAYLVANPSLTHSQAASVIVTALQERFPCRTAANESGAAGQGPSRQ